MNNPGPNNVYYHAGSQWARLKPEERTAARRQRTARRLRDLRTERNALSVALDREATDHAEAIRQRDELRAVLAPLLDAPIYRTTCEEPVCVFCRRTHDWEPDFEHVPDCPALPANRDRLLGRLGALE